ncbi:hypothetical protein V1T76_28410 [Roseibium sp. FZY0029]|uniref:hypothetical protein n=1 Tax=Roseibium sp. FZY0029 TaxID=3116647 RepID=UPI002ECC1DF1|nr:hypothetical protein [Roseibium sp. FZY0029]
MSDRDFKIAAIALAVGWPAYFLLLMAEAKSRSADKVFWALASLTIILFGQLINRKRKQEDPSFFNEFVICFVGWTSYYLVTQLNSKLIFLNHLFYGLFLFSMYTAVLALAIWMRKIENKDKLY